MNKPTIVVLVDNKLRDLPACALIAEYIEKLGGHCVLVPLEGYRSALEAFRPSIILFNHLLAGHLVHYSQRLRDMGVKVAVLPNEMLLYHRDVLLFNTRKRHPDTHVDIYFSWGEHQREALYENDYDPAVTKVYVVGNPKFDFYFKPYSDYYLRKSAIAKGKRPRLLVCTNFCFAKYHTLPKADGERFFSMWAEQIELYKDFPAAIAACFRGRERFMKFFQALVQADRYEIVLRPHPSEDREFYRPFLDALPADQRRHVVFDLDSSIYEQILNCDLEVSCETCTTALEAWMAGKPTIELSLEKHEMYYHHDISLLNVLCEEPDQLLGTVEDQLAQPDQTEFTDVRAAHLKKWVDTPKGDSCRRVAEALIAETETAKPDWSKLRFSDFRRGWKHRLLEAVGKPCNYNPFLALKLALMPARYRARKSVMDKTIFPAGVYELRSQMSTLIRGK